MPKYGEIEIPEHHRDVARKLLNICIEGDEQGYLPMTVLIDRLATLFELSCPDKDCQIKFSCAECKKNALGLQKGETECSKFITLTKQRCLMK